MRYRPAAQIATIGRNERNVRQYSIDPRNFAKIASILSGLYPRPIPAIAREYLTNARDSHLSAGQLRPIEVTIGNGIFAVEDFGIGLTIDQLDEIWTSYGASTKEDDEDQTGALGMGSKSAYTYADLWTVVARKDGVQAIGINSKASTGVPEFEIVDTSATNEPNGVRVEIPIREADVHRFEAAVEEILAYWPSASVVVNGEPNVALIDTDTPRLELDPDVQLYQDGDDPVLVMGGVPYSVAEHLLGVGYDEKIVANVPLGAVDFTPARELELSEKTQEVLDELKDFIAERKAVAFDEMLANAPSIWDGLVLQYQWSSSRRAILQNRTRYFKAFQGYKRGGWGHRSTRATKHEGQIGIPTLIEATVVIGFPHKGVSERHKEILDFHGINTNTVLIQGHRIADEIDGHPDVRVWSELVETAPKPVRAKREKAEHVVYTIVSSDFAHTLVQGEDHGFDHILYHTGEDYSVDRDRIAAYQALGLFPAGSWAVAIIQDRQINKFTRIYPEAEEFGKHFDWHRAVELAQQADASVIREQAYNDRLRFSGLGGFTSYIEPKDIADPELRRLAELQEGRTDSPEYRAFTTLRITHFIPTASEELTAEIDHLNTVPRRYPLLSLRGVDEDAAKSILSAINTEYRLRTLQGR